MLYEPLRDKTNKMTVAQRRLRSAWASAQSDQSLRCTLNGLLRTQALFMRTANTLIRLGGCPGWSESSLGAHAILLVLSRGGSNHLKQKILIISIHIQDQRKVPWRDPDKQMGSHQTSAISFNSRHFRKLVLLFSDAETLFCSRY